MDEILSKVSGLILSLLLVVGAALLIALPVMWLWDWLMPIIFGLNEITLFQALGLSILTGILFKSNK